MDNDLERASKLDLEDPLRQFREGFIIPTMADVGAKKIPKNRLKDPCVYLCGNSLGLMNRKSREYVDNELGRWGKLGVLGHFAPSNKGWVNQADSAHILMSSLIGAKPQETVCMGTLTANLHLLMNAFYNPTPTRYKILCEAHAFPSDQYAFFSQTTGHGFDPSTAVISLRPRSGEYTLRLSDILSTLSEQGSEIALVLFPGVQYYTGQYFPIAQITAAAHKQGCLVGWDLAHAVGNVELKCHDWDIDSAVWCSYKYVNAGAGGIGGMFIHEKWNERKLKRQAGWWGHTLSTRFKMPEEFSPIAGAHGWQQSNPSMLDVASLQGSLEVFAEAGGIVALREKSLKLTGYFADLLIRSQFYENNQHGFKIITNNTPEERGCQLSLLIYGGENMMDRVLEGLQERGVISDERRPDVIRLAPTPLYNTFEECWYAAKALDEVFRELS